MSKKYLHCDFCGFDKIIESDNIPAKIVLPPVQKTLPKLDSEQKFVAPTYFPKKILHKCSNCGRGVIEKSLPQPFQQLLKKIENQKEKTKQEEDRKKRIEDGKPLEKNKIFDEEKNNNS